jgi:hypothetical protein
VMAVYLGTLLLCRLRYGGLGQRHAEGEMAEGDCSAGDGSR